MRAIYLYLSYRLLVVSVILNIAPFTLPAQWNINATSEVYSLNSAVGIGVTDPSGKLEIRGGTDNNFLFVRQDKNSGGAADVIYFRDDRGYGGNNTGTTLKIESWRGYGQQGGTLVNFTTIDNGFYKSRFFIDNDNGYVGLGTTSPAVPLQVDGSSGLLARLRVASAYVGSSAAFDIVMGDQNYAGGMRAYIRDGQPGIDRVSLGFYTSTHTSSLESRVERMTITDRGNVGIGITTPDAKLAVKGDIHTREVRVDLDGSMVPDYVFETDYKLLSLDQIEDYISENKRLPEVPSAEEMGKNGLHLKEMNLLLLKKVEELTLHLITQNKINEQQAKELDDLKLKIEALR